MVNSAGWFKFFLIYKYGITSTIQWKSMLFEITFFFYANFWLYGCTTSAISGLTLLLSFFRRLAFVLVKREHGNCYLITICFVSRWETIQVCATLTVILELWHTFLLTPVEQTAMNPTHYPVQPAQVQGSEGLPGAAPVQYTTVNIPAEPPKDHIIWSLCCFVYSNPCCLGLAALIFSIKVSLCTPVHIVQVQIHCYDISM